MATTSMKKVNDRDFNYWKAQHLLNRAGFGGTPGNILALRNMGPEDAVDYLIDYRDVEAEAVLPNDFDSNINKPRSGNERQRFIRARQQGNETALEEFRKQRQEQQRIDRRQMANIQTWWLERMIETPRPFQEKMALFWHGHFAAAYRPIEDSYLLFLQNQLFRSNAVGNFKDDLVHGIIRDPAMIKYLNNNQNNKNSPNENLARELMELFTLGEGRGYTENDIKQGARTLTGYTYRDNEFQYLSQNHDDGLKSIFGKSGRWDGHDFVEMIFTRPSASQFICEKLYRFYVNDSPNGFTREQQSVIRKMTAKLKSSKWELKPVLRQLFLSEHFYDEDNVGAVIKSPVQLVIQAIRSLRTPTRNLPKLNEACALMGQSIFHPPSVKGWEGGRKWINTSTLFIRQNILLYLLTGRDEGSRAWDRGGSTEYDATHLVQHLEDIEGSSTVQDGVVYLLRFAHPVAAPDGRRVDEWVEYVNNRGGRFDNTTLINILALITASPEYQLS